MGEEGEYKTKGVKDDKSLTSMYHPMYVAYEKYLSGDTGALETLKPEHREVLSKAIKVLAPCKTAFQASQETGIPSDVFFIMHMKQRKAREQFIAVHSKRAGRPNRKTETQHMHESQNELLKCLKLKKEPVCASVVASEVGISVQSAYYRLRRLEKRGKVRKNKTSGYVTWEIIKTGSQSK